MRIAVVVGSIREGRRGRGVGDWVIAQAADRDPEYVLVDLVDHPLTMRYEQKLDKTYDEPSTQAWSDLIDSFDGYVFVTPEYNRSVPAPLKNAVDLLFSEWGDKGLAFVSYGGVGGARSVEHWRTIAATLSLHTVSAAVHAGLRTDFDENGFAPQAFRAKELGKVLDALESLTERLRS
ncbi:NADPH-dependent FMN reductase [Nocardioides yefusunii]|uniref:NADPH-dependent FMN reductase n=1 Tax=Nocardioides yefusunii TaxID=2500546 RepID=A0ABW1QTP2_9ACTN|nr:NADPH-dependent FMN reductase [Nocardioides yefusunii]